jgi:hypothetical protein
MFYNIVYNIYKKYICQDSGYMLARLPKLIYVLTDFS